MILEFFGIIAGIWFVLQGADKLTDGAVSIAQRMKMPAMIIGLTVVALGTSMPELFVSISSVMQGVTDIAVANVVGSNTFNVLLIAGVAASVTPMTISKTTVKRDIPVAALSSLLLLGCGALGVINRWMATIFLILLIAYTVYAIRTATPDDASDIEQKNYPLWKSFLYVAGGLIALVMGSNMFVSCASGIATMLGISDAIIGLTIVAGGTSLPELATSVVAARKGQSAIAMGNVLGSCVYNILLIIGLTGIISPLVIVGVTPIDFGIMALSIFLLWFFSFTKYKLEQWEGMTLVAIFCAYMGYLLYNI